MSIPRRIAALCLVVAAAAPPACRRSSVATYTIAGQVVDEANAPVPGAVLNVGSFAGRADDGGAFTATTDAATGDTLSLSVSAGGYVARTLRLTVVDGAPPALQVVLRPIGLTTTVAVPAAGQPPAVVSLVRTDSTSQLSIPAGSLVTAAGLPVNGNVTVSMTYWQAGESMLSAPGPLAGVVGPAGPPVPLHSAGMIDLHIAQNGDEVQVAPGATLPWQVQLGAASRAFYATSGAALQHMALWSLDAEQAAFVAPSAPGTVIYDTGGATLTAGLTHLSCWNYDYNCSDQDIGGNCMTTDNGGCVQGTAYTCSGAPLANAEVRLWAIGRGNVIAAYDGVKDFSVATDAAGHYCATLGTEPGAVGTAATLLLHLSGADGPTESNLACPLTGRCQLCDQEPTYCNSCAGGTDSGVPAPTALSYTIHTGDYCPSTACTALPDLYVGPECVNVGSCPSAPLPLGAACNPKLAPNKNSCCAPGLSCLDGVCVTSVSSSG